MEQNSTFIKNTMFKIRIMKKFLTGRKIGDPIMHRLPLIVSSNRKTSLAHNHHHQ